ncbi:SRPBCC family protein [Dermatophilaceae bacterium Soc4.6]
MQRTIEVSGPASVEQVWQRYAVISAWHTWSPPIRTVEATAPRIAAGVTGIVRGVAGVFLTFRIESVDEQARSWTWRVNMGPLTAMLGHGVRLAEGEAGSVATLTVEAIAPIALGYPQVARLALHRLVAAQT